MGEQPATDPTSSSFVPVCAIGASAGGVGVLQSLFRLLPVDLGLAYVVVMHLSPDHPSAMDEILAACTRMPVFQVLDGPPLKANCVFVIPPDRELVIEGNNVKARPFTDPRGHRTPIDLFFRSIAAGRGDGIAVVLTGAGSDGAVGVRAIKEAGGIVMVQDPAEAGFPSMPQNAIATGVADVVAPIEQLAERIAEAARSKTAIGSLDEEGAANDLRRIVVFLRTCTGHDFSGYKRPTVLRRVMRRMQVCQITSLPDYAHHLRGTPDEARELFADLLISVTMFFRDPAAFEALGRHVVRPLIENMGGGDGNGELRAWVVGCATGEEAYSLAIMILEQAEHLKVHVPVQIFATDLDESALATARDGRYPRSIETDVSAERLKRFFVDEGTHYRISRQVRDLVLFATHSVVREPPFVQLDLVSCRNVLIYLERPLQQHVSGIFHYSLKRDRFLFLGTAEAVDTAQNEFASVDRDAHIYRSRVKETAALPVLGSLSGVSPNRPFQLPDRIAPVRFEVAETLRASHVAALEASAPPSAIVDADYVVLHLSPTAGRFILLSAGPLSGKLPSIVRPELRLDLRIALGRAFDIQQPSATRSLDVGFDNEIRRVSAHVVPMPRIEGSAPRAIVYFHDNGPSRTANVTQDAPLPDDVKNLHDELKAAQEAAVSERLGHEASQQELRASNEELQSLNEEYRSTAEELESSKEELQSLNEELHTVNAELRSKLTVLSAAHNDLQNLTSSSEIGTLFLDTDLRIRMFTPPVAELINLTGADVGRPITNFTHRLDDDGLEQDVRRVMLDLAPIEKQVRSLDNRWFMLRVRPYRTIDGKIEGAVITFDDITTRKQGESTLRDSEERFAQFAASSSDALWIRDAATLAMEYVSSAIRTIYGVPPEQLLDSPDNWTSLIVPEDRGKALAHLEQARNGDAVTHEFRILRSSDESLRWIRNTDFPLRDAHGRVQRIGGIAKDVTELKSIEAALTQSEQRLRTLVDGVPQLVWRAVHGGAWTWASSQWTAYTGQLEPDSHRLGWLEPVHPDDRDRATAVWDHSPETGGFEVEYRIRRASDGMYYWFQTRATPLLDRPGEIVEWLGTSTDIEDLKRLQDSQAVMVAELQHRTRNLIAVVRGIADDTMDHTGPTEAFRSAFADRLSALSRVQGLLSRSDADPITIEALVRLELDAIGAHDWNDRITVVGPEMYLRPSTVQTLALALHELATNARKYGALSHDSGRLAVMWREVIEGGVSRLVLDWIETGLDEALDRSPPIAPSGGYGRELIEQALPHALGARTSYALTEAGVRCIIDLPVRPGSLDGGQP